MYLYLLVTYLYLLVLFLYYPGPPLVLCIICIIFVLIQYVYYVLSYSAACPSLVPSSSLSVPAHTVFYPSFTSFYRPRKRSCLSYNTYCTFCTYHVGAWRQQSRQEALRRPPSGASGPWLVPGEPHFATSRSSVCSAPAAWHSGLTANAPQSPPPGSTEGEKAT